MPQGLQIFNSSSELVMDYTTAIIHTYGSFPTSSNITGSYTDARLIGNSLFIFPIPAVGGSLSGYGGGPEIIFTPSTGTIEWDYQISGTGFPPPNASNRNHILIYGGF